MILAPWDEPTVLAALRPSLSQGQIRGVMLSDVIEPAALAAARRRLEASGWAPFYAADRGRYRRSRARPGAELPRRLRAMAEAIWGRPLRARKTEGLLFKRGDYALRLDDALLRPKARRFVEVTLDLSAHATGESEVWYTKGPQAMYVVPQIPGFLSMVERTPEVTRFERYLTHRVGRARVVRMRMVLGFD